MTRGKGEHPSASKVQSEAEKTMLDMLNAELKLALIAEDLRLENDARVRVDGVDRRNKVLCEAYAHIGQVKSGQRQKLSQDILKLIAIRSDSPSKWARVIVAVADETVKACLKGGSWLAAVVANYNIEVRVVDLPGDVRAQILNAQCRQRR